MIDDETREPLGKVPSGERGRAADEASRDRLRRRQRRDARAALAALGERLPPVSTDEVGRWIREDRDRAID